ncbi:MAG: hypothetical protein QXN55_01115 [Candidatus Nitrosotenuis sp.]
MRITEIVNDEILTEVRQEANLVSKFKDVEEYEGNINMAGHYITSLRGAPRIVNGNFNVENNPLLKSLRFAPVHIHGNFNASKCDIQTLRGCTTKTVGGKFCINENSFKSTADLIGAPEDIAELDIAYKLGFDSLSGINKAFKSINQKIFISPSATHVLGLLLIRNLKKIVIGRTENSRASQSNEAMNLAKVVKILNTHLATGEVDMLEAKAEIIETYSGNAEILALAKS